MNGKVVVLSGASRGLGKALAVGFAERGAALGICARDRTRLSTLSGILKRMECPHVALAFDLQDETSAQEFIQSLLSSFGRIDVLINNASVLGHRREIASYPTQEWKEVMAINVNGAFYLTKHVLKIMFAQREGSIINVSSSVGRKGRRHWGAYAVSKFALEGLTEVLADELQGTGIRVNSVNPGPIDTEMRRAAYPDEDPAKLKRPEDVLEVFFHLASDESRAVTGQRFDAQTFTDVSLKVN